MAKRVAARFLGTISLSLALATPAWADWYAAESDNFVVYADDKEKDVQRFAEYLESYHSALELLEERRTAKPSPSSRVTIFVVGDDDDIKDLVGPGGKNVAGFYIARAGGSKAFVQDIEFSARETPFTMVVLLHEYAHHFLISSSKFARPRWMNEGAAEFFASTLFMRDGTVSIGRPAVHRFTELTYANEVSVEELIDHEVYEENRKKGYDAFYGRSWLLYHYLRLSDERDGQLDEFKKALESGKSPREAAEDVFGDLDQLERDLGRYAKKRSMEAYNFTPDWLKVRPVSVRKLPEGEAAMMPVRIRSQRGVDEEQAAELVIEARTIAAQYPDDPGVLTALAEAEFDAGNDAGAIAAADRAIALDPNRPNAYVQKGYALFRMAEKADDKDTAYAKAMATFGALNKIETDHPIPLIYYYRSFAERGITPPENARHALERASQLAPFDKDLAFEAAMMQAQEGKIELARFTLAPLAADPHGGPLADRATSVRALLLKAEEGEPFSPPPFIAAPVEVGNDEEE